MEIIKNINTGQLKEIISNRYPYLLIDFALEIVPGVRAKAYKNMSANEWFFAVHFPEEPMMPGMLQVEAMLQTLSLTVLSLRENQGGQIRCCSADKIRLKKHVVPGMRLDIEAELVSYENGVAKGSVIGRIGNEEACSAQFTFEVKS